MDVFGSVLGPGLPTVFRKELRSCRFLYAAVPKGRIHIVYSEIPEPKPI